MTAAHKAFDEFEPGEEIDTYGRTVTEADIVNSRASPV